GARGARAAVRRPALDEVGVGREVVPGVDVVVAGGDDVVVGGGAQVARDRGGDRGATLDGERAAFAEAVLHVDDDQGAQRVTSLRRRSEWPVPRGRASAPPTARTPAPRAGVRGTPPVWAGPAPARRP